MPEFRQVQVCDRRVLAALSLGPDPKDKAQGYVLCTTGGQHTVFDAAIYAYYPGPEYPTHLLIWTPGSAHVFDYHCLEYNMTLDRWLDGGGAPACPAL